MIVRGHVRCHTTRHKDSSNTTTNLHQTGETYLLSILLAYLTAFPLPDTHSNTNTNLNRWAVSRHPPPSFVADLLSQARRRLSSSRNEMTVLAAVRFIGVFYAAARASNVAAAAVRGRWAFIS